MVSSFSLQSADVIEQWGNKVVNEAIKEPTVVQVPGSDAAEFVDGFLRNTTTSTSSTPARYKYWSRLYSTTGTVASQIVLEFLPEVV